MAGLCEQADRGLGDFSIAIHRHKTVVEPWEGAGGALSAPGRTGALLQGT